MGGRLKWGILGGTGAVLVILGFALGFGAFPAIITSQVEGNLDLFDQETEGYKNFVSIELKQYHRY